MSRASSTPPLFTAPDAWNGGSYELAIELGPVDDQRLGRALRAVWSASFLSGCSLRADAEPEEQARVTPADEQLELSTVLRGLVTLPPHGVVPCSTIPVREEGGSDWLYFGLPMGSLARILPVGAFPWADGTDLSWRNGLDEWLRGLAAHVYAAVPFELALVGWTDGGTETASAIRESGVPRDRWVGYLVPAGGELRWYPANQGAPISAGP